MNASDQESKASKSHLRTSEVLKAHQCCRAHVLVGMLLMFVTLHSS